MTINFAYFDLNEALRPVYKNITSSAYWGFSVKTKVKYANLMVHAVNKFIIDIDKVVTIENAHIVLENGAKSQRIHPGLAAFGRPQ